MINPEDLLQPVSADKPCGEDFTYHPSFQNLETISRGKTETQFSPAEEPNWKEVRDAATEVLGQSKHLTAGVILTLSLMKIGGLEGFRDGLAVVRGLVERYWDGVYPKLDPDDNNDPTERLNILNNLSSAGDPYRFTVHLKQLVLCESPSMGKITLQQVVSAKERSGKDASGEPAPAGAGPDLNQIQAAFRDVGPATAAATLGFVNEVVGHAQGIETFLDSKLGAGRGVNFEALNKLLRDMQQVLQPHATGDAPAAEAGAADAEGGGGGQAPTRSGQAVSGTIQSRADVIKALNLVCDYYRDNEPSSPVPLILQRAQRLVDMDFMAIVNDLTPDAMSQLKVITGKKDE